MDSFRTIDNSFLLLFIAARLSILDVCRSAAPLLHTFLGKYKDWIPSVFFNLRIPKVQNFFMSLTHVSNYKNQLIDLNETQFTGF